MIELRAIVLAHTATVARPALSALFDLDATLGRIVASTSEPMIGQMRLTWWHERLSALGQEAVPAEPVLNALRHMVAQSSVTGVQLAAMVEGWEVLLDSLPLDDSALRLFAEHRGDGLFAIAATVCGDTVPTGIGAGWALIDFAMHCSDEYTATKAVKMARTYFSHTKISGPKPLRILSWAARAKAMQSPDQIHEPLSRMMILKAVLR